MKEDLETWITGIGLVWPGGDSIGDFVRGLGDPPPLAKPIWGGASGFTIDDAALHDRLQPAQRRRMDRIAQMTTVAVGLALDDAGITSSRADVGLFMDTAFGSAHTVVRIMDGVLGPEAVVSPLLFPGVVANHAAGQACIAYGLRGPSSTFGALGALLGANLLLARGACAQAVVVGADEVVPLIVQAMMSVGVLEGGAVRVGEAACAVVLETADAARSRGRVPLARLGEVHMASDPAFHLDRGDAFGHMALHSVLQQTGTATEWIVSAGNGSRTLARREAAALGKQLGRIPVSTPKGRTGETFGAAAIIAVATAAEVLAGRSAAPRVANPSSALVLAQDATRGQALSALVQRA